MRTKKRIIGDIGENIVSNFLKDKGYIIIEQNYLKKFGEIDIIALLNINSKKKFFLKKRKKELYFFEVKTISIGNKNINEMKYLPEDNFTKTKIRKFNKIVEFYIKDNKIKNDYYLGVIYVYLDIKNKKAKIKLIEKIEI